MGETIVFSICNKPFKPLGIHSERVKSREGFFRNDTHKQLFGTMLLMDKALHTNTWFIHH